jgi:hypothetical protein
MISIPMELKNLSKKIKDITFIPWSYIVSGSNTGNISQDCTTQTNEMHSFLKLLF